MAKQPTQRKQWTVMVYLAGDNNLDLAGVADLKEMKRVGSTDAINIIAQFDRLSPGLKTNRYYLKKGGKLEADAVASLPKEVDTGDPKALIDFFLWGAKNYSAHRYLAILWNHGAGWDDTDIYRAAGKSYTLTRRGTPLPGGKTGDRGLSVGQVRRVAGTRIRQSFFRTSAEKALSLAAKGGSQERGILFDDNAKDFLDNLEMKAVLASVAKSLKQPIDVLGMDACLMNMAEVAYQVRQSVTAMVGSEEVEPGDGWPYDKVLGALAAKPNMTAKQLASVIVKKYVASYPSSENVTQSACDLACAEALASAVNSFADVLIAGLGDSATRMAILQARNQVQEYYVPENIDLVDFCHLLKQTPGLSSLVAAQCDAMTAAVQGGQGIVFEAGYKGSAMQHSNGLAIYFPTRSVSPLYAHLDFAKQTHWAQFLEKYVAQTRARG